MPFKLRSDSRCRGFGLSLAFMFLAGCGADQSDGTMDLKPDQIKKLEQGHIDAAKSGAYGDPAAKPFNKKAR